MKKIKVLKSLMECGVVSVVRGDTKETGVQIGKACIKGGVKAIEITYTNKYATDIIRELTDEYENVDEVCIGAGTVLDSSTARMAILAGAEYIVSPAFNEETAIMCNRYKVPYIPGVMTINEIIKAHEVGVDVVKLFPGSAFSPSYIKGIKGPLPYANIMVTGGVNIENLDKWIEAGAELVGIGGELNTLGEKGEFLKIENICKEYAMKIKEVRGK
ncbi:MAG: bifunctional 2-keto-4-hydroxyglutarate aldolase/2-keto-3-deoxy-6-phosphogluconate aldolase [Clostridium sp.]